MGEETIGYASSPMPARGWWGVLGRISVAAAALAGAALAAGVFYPRLFDFFLVTLGSMLVGVVCGVVGSCGGKGNRWWGLAGLLANFVVFFFFFLILVASAY